MIINRRHLLMTGAAAVSACATRQPTANISPLVVETAQGRYRGLSENGVMVFRGMRYGESTAGRNRFMPPQAPSAWAGIREAYEFGDQSPQQDTFLAGAETMSDDCLRINVWTPAADTAKRPVMLWFHGGGFEAGAGSINIYDGTNIAKRGDVVVATINHRLNVFGHCHLGDVLGDDFARSGNVGYLDLVAAMNWVRTNISRFGGDPDNIMIYGQSGGGRKVSLCYAGEDAEGLFHKGAIQSGAHIAVQPREMANELTYELLKELQIAPGDAIKLQTLSVAELTAAQLKVRDRMRNRFSPVLDGECFEQHPFYPEAPKRSSHLPLIVGTTRTELTSQLGRRPGIFDMDKAQAMGALKMFLPQEDIKEAFETFQASRPEANPSEVFFTIASARGYVRDQTLLAEARARSGGTGDTYVYRLMWRQPVEGGRRVSQHSLDLPFVFDNVDTVPHITGPETEETRAMVDAMANAWISFAHDGNPNNPSLPEWKPFGLEDRYTMMFDVPSHLESDPHKAEREFMSRYESQQLKGVALHRR
ncbi:carboxylesterase/lipase family protein [Hyphomonas beringensis]|nr:carboxylesterase family protein [Hyphomonas beringensis]